MQFMSSWSTRDRRTLVHFTEPALNQFIRFIQKSASDLEAGGILLGTVHGSNLIVTEVTIPTTSDKRSHYFFERMPVGHDAVAHERWASSEGIIRYLGEWHTHPENYPRPSQLDEQEWIRLASLRQDNRPMLAVIVGRNDLHVELMCSPKSNFILFGVE